MKKKWILWGSIAIVVLIAIGAYTVYDGYRDALDEMHVEDESTKDKEEQKTEKVQEKFEPFAVLLYGIDQREESGDKGRPDTLMLALVDAQEKKVNLISIPRDSYVEIPDRSGRDKINHTFTYGGVQLTMQTIEEWLGIPLYGYVAIDFQGFQELVDIVGGVDINVDRSIQYDDPIDGTHIRLEQGQQVLDGKNALDFVRARLDNRGSRYYTSDYLRMERQQLVLKELGREIVSLKSVPKIFDIMKAVGDNVATTLTPDELDYLVRKFATFNMQNLETTSIVGEPLHLDTGWYEDVPQEEVDRVHELATNFLQRIPTPVKTENDADAEGQEPKGDASGDSEREDEITG